MPLLPRSSQSPSTLRLVPVTESPQELLSKSVSLPSIRAGQEILSYTPAARPVRSIGAARSLSDEEGTPRSSTTGKIWQAHILIDLGTLINTPRCIRPEDIGKQIQNIYRHDRHYCGASPQEHNYSGGRNHTYTGTEPGSYARIHRTRGAGMVQQREYIRMSDRWQYGEHEL